jgi:hypothetical protein
VEQDWLRLSDEIEHNSGNRDDKSESGELRGTDDGGGKKEGRWREVGAMEQVAREGDETGRGKASQIKDRR